MIARVAVSAVLRASHRDLIMDEGLHEHAWTFWAWFDAEPFRDLRSQRIALETVLSPFQGKELAPEMWAGEAMAEMFARVLANCIGMTVERPGFRGEVWL